MVQAREFLHCCRSGYRPLADGRSGLEMVTVLEAADRSLAANGEPIPVIVPDIGTRRPILAVA